MAPVPYEPTTTLSPLIDIRLVVENVSPAWNRISKLLGFAASICLARSNVLIADVGERPLFESLPSLLT